MPENSACLLDCLTYLLPLFGTSCHGTARKEPSTIYVGHQKKLAKNWEINAQTERLRSMVTLHHVHMRILPGAIASSHSINQPREMALVNEHSDATRGADTYRHRCAQHTSTTATPSTGLRICTCMFNSRNPQLAAAS